MKRTVVHIVSTTRRLYSKREALYWSHAGFWLVNHMSGIPPGEHVIKDTGMLPVTWTKGTFSNMKGKLTLTNARLIFTAGHFQDIISAVRGAHMDRVEIPLNTIVKVEKGFMATITVHAGEKYTFRDMGDVDG